MFNPPSSLLTIKTFSKTNLLCTSIKLYYSWKSTVAHKCKTNVSFQNNVYLFETLCSFFKTNHTLFKINVSFQNKCFISKQMFSFQNKCFVPLSWVLHDVLNAFFLYLTSYTKCLQSGSNRSATMFCEFCDILIEENFGFFVKVAE